MLGPLLSPLVLKLKVFFFEWANSSATQSDFCPLPPGFKLNSLQSFLRLGAESKLSTVSKLSRSVDPLRRSSFLFVGEKNAHISKTFTTAMGPFINNVRTNGGRGVNQVRTNENMGEGGLDSETVHKYRFPKCFK